MVVKILQDYSDRDKPYTVVREDASNKNLYVVLGKFNSLDNANNYILSLCR